MPEPDCLTSRLEQAIFPLSTSGGAPLLGAGGYVAIVDRSPEVELGTDAAREEASFHVIFGRW
jgi:hypothetical protein